MNTLAVVRKGERLTFDEWADFFLENYSKPPIRAQKTHIANQNALKNLRPAMGYLKLAEIEPDHVENYLRLRLKQRKRVKRGNGFVALGYLKATTGSLVRLVPSPLLDLDYLLLETQYEWVVHGLRFANIWRNSATSAVRDLALLPPQTFAAAKPKAEPSKSRTKKPNASRLRHRCGGGGYVEDDVVRIPGHATETGIA